MNYDDFKCSIMFEKENETILTSSGWQKTERIGDFTIKILKILNTKFKSLLLSNPYNIKNLTISNLFSAFTWLVNEIEREFDDVTTFFLIGAAQIMFKYALEKNDSLKIDDLSVLIGWGKDVRKAVDNVCKIYDIKDSIEEDTILYYMFFLFHELIDNFNNAQLLINLFFNIEESTNKRNTSAYLLSFLTMYEENVNVKISFNGTANLTFMPETFLGFTLLELNQLSNLNMRINKCKNCGNYFIPLRRSDTIYCDEASPQDKSRTCKEYGKTRTYLTNIKDDEMKYYHRQKYNRLRNRAKRHPEQKENFNEFIHKNAEWQIKLKDNPTLEKKYIEWLKGED